MSEHNVSSLMKSTRQSNASQEYEAAAQIIEVEIDDATALRAEAELSHTPNDLLLHAQLIGHYFRKRLNVSGTGLHVQHYHRHVLCLIRHHPAAPLAGKFYCLIFPHESPKEYQKCKQLWQQQTVRHPNNPGVLRNAARYLFCGSIYIYTPGVERLWQRVLALEPEDNHSRDTLGWMYIEKMGRTTHQNRRRWAIKALEQYLTLEQTDREGHYQAVTAHVIACLAVEAKREELAVMYAMPLLQADAESPLCGISVHCGHFVLGSVALRQNNVEEAKQHLLAMGEVQSNVYFAVNWPFMQLANELLERGEREVVVRYLSACERLITEENENLEVVLTWKQMVEQGAHPDFWVHDYLHRLLPFLY